MYAQDLLTTHKMLQSASNDALLFPLITLLQSEFFYLEQLLNYQGLSSNVEKTEMQKDHHLLGLLAKTSVPMTEELKILQDLFLGNVWIRSTYEQLLQREGWNVPEYLHTIKQIYETDKLSTCTPLINKIKDTFKRTIQFSSHLPVMKMDLSLNARKMEVEAFQHQTVIEMKKCDSIAATCQQLFNRISLLWHPKLKQIICHLKMLKGILRELNKESIDSDVFSLLVRSFLFWENTILEEFLQLSVGVKTGVDTYSHNLENLFEELLTNKKSDKELQRYSFLKETMANIHNFSRYPFIHHASDFIRNVVLQAELLRERPELGQKNPFKLENNRTDLNYIEVSSDQFTPDGIVNKLNEIHTKVFEIITENILPRLNSTALRS